MAVNKWNGLFDVWCPECERSQGVLWPEGKARRMAAIHAAGTGHHPAPAGR